MGNSIADCNKALDINPNLPDGYYHRAFAYEALLKTDAAIADFNKFISLSDNQVLIETARQEIIKLMAPVLTPTTTSSANGNGR